ncbi:hypothetical protein EOPP23_17490 [Endozoicomonas sp. OPT23]|uniref:nitrate reductase cytochrome c-type subunit n=1 Tax=Endozoicomonas sp. OPT23 TaxID=2072845 RepID=UPI00129BD036|nr:nitrate reductase cytochrome c-type subunit [Endozoicomonas sp. OPT23]MRI34778.1 hypothetical protein [Endozoicomonas sp. OPT23]
MKLCHLKRWFLFALTAVVLCHYLLPQFAIAAGNDKPVESLRGPAPLSEEKKAPALKKFPKERELLDLNYVGQPPLIPHSIRGYKITANDNRCLHCHSWDNAISSGATRIGISHFRDRDGRVLADVSPSRYFCTQCHVPQINAKPLVPNTFEPVESLKTP